MSTHAAVARLLAVTSTVRESLADIGQMTDDLPAGRDTVVLDLVRDACDDVDGWLAMIEDAGTVAHEAGRQRNSADVAAGLSRCASGYRRAVHAFVTGIGGVDSLSRLRQLAADRPDALRLWAWAVQERVASAWTGLGEVGCELDLCWDELVEHLLDDPVEVQARLVPSSRTVTDALAGGQ